MPLLPGLPLLLTVTTMVLDLTGDGKRDMVRLEWDRTSVSVRIRFANPARPPQQFHFGVDSGREDAVCRVPVQLRREPPHGFQVVDGVCDSLHFVWNARTKRVEWWRL